MKTYLADSNIKLSATQNEQKVQIVEKLNRTIKGILFRYFAKKNTRRYIDILEDIAYAYYRRSIKWLLKMLGKTTKLKSG